MLLTIHNLPITTHYSDVKSLLHEKCGLTDIIVDNLVSEGKSMKVTVGLANENDGAFVVRKLNGLFINGQQLYIEHKRRNATGQEQPYRPPVNLIQESRGFEQAHINNMMQTAMAPNPPNWNQNVTAPYMPRIPAEQNVSYSGYGGVPQTSHYMEPLPVPAEKERYSGFQGDNYIPITSGGPGLQAPDWGKNGREQPSHAPRHDRKRRHSPERSAAPKQSRRETRIFAGQNRREEAVRAVPPQQWPEPNQGSRPPFRQPEQFTRNQHPKVDDRYPRNQHPNLDDRFPRNQHQNADDRFPRNQHQNADDRFPRNQHQNADDRFPHKQHQNLDDRYQPREPSPPYGHTDPQWETKRWDEPEPNPRSQHEREWGNDNHGNWENQPVKVWNNPPKQQWREEPRQWDDEPNPQWEANYSSMPVEDNRPEWYDREEHVSPPRENAPEFRPRDQGHRESGPRKSRFDDRNSGSNWNSKPDNRSGSRPVPSSNRQGRPAEEMQRRDRPRSKNGRQEREWRDDRPNALRERSSGAKKPDFGRQGPKNYPETKRQQRPEFDRRDTRKDIQKHAIPRHERDATYRSIPIMREEMNYPPRKRENKPDSLRAMINRDQSNRGQATSLIAKTVIGLPKATGAYIASSPCYNFVFKELKRCIKARVDVELGEELCTDIGEVVKKYRTKYPINQDKSLWKQIREKATKEYEEIQERKAREEEIKKEIKNEPEAKKEAETANNSQKEDILNQARLEAENETKEHQGTADSENKAPKAVKTPVPPVPPNMPKRKPGKPLTDKQIIQQMKLQRKWEYDQDDLYSLDEVTTKALDDEMAELDKLFTDECSKPDGPQEAAICKRITTDCLSDFHKTIRLYITKRFLNIQTGLTVRIFGHGKLPNKTAMKEYLKKYRINNMTLKKSVKGTMFMINLTRFQDFDNLCRLEHDVIDGTPVSFKAMHLIGPPPKMNKNQVKAMRERFINEQIDKDTDLAEFEDTTDYGAAEEDNEEKGVSEEKEDFAETEDITEDVADAGDFEDEAETADLKEDFVEDINIGNINEEDLEDF